MDNQQKLYNYIKDTTESTTSASYLDLLLSIGKDGRLVVNGATRNAQCATFPHFKFIAYTL